MTYVTLPSPLSLLSSPFPSHSPSPLSLPHLPFFPFASFSFSLSSSFSFPFFTDIDIKISWFAKLLEAMAQADPATGGSVANYANICTALDLLAFLLQVGTN